MAMVWMLKYALEICFFFYVSWNNDRNSTNVRITYLLHYCWWKKKSSVLVSFHTLAKDLRCIRFSLFIIFFTFRSFFFVCSVLVCISIRLWTERYDGCIEVHYILRVFLQMQSVNNWRRKENKEKIVVFLAFIDIKICAAWGAKQSHADVYST